MTRPLVFLSHSSKDKPLVRLLADALEAGDEIKTWLDERDIDFSDNIVSKIDEGLEADFVLLILSPDSVASKWVKEEWTAAYWQQMEGEGKLGLVMLRDCKRPRLLANKKYFDARKNQTEAYRAIKSWILGHRPPPPPIVHLPQRSQRFIGREPEIAELRRRLREEGSVVYVPGLPGRGKTSLAVEYAHRWQRDFESVHWLPCEGRTLAQIAGELEWQLGLNLEGDLEKNLRELMGVCTRKRCLLVLDNVDDETPAGLMPAGRSSVLITTRRKDLRFLRTVQPLDLPLFSENQCFELFIRELGEAEVEKHRVEASTLFARLGFLPFAIAVAASLIREDVRYTIARMAANPPADVKELLAKAIGTLSSEARILLAATAVCAPEGFRLGIAAEIAGFDEDKALDTLQEIHARSLVEELDRDVRRYRLHALVRETGGGTDELRRKHAEVLRNEFKDWETNWQQCAEDMADWQVAFSWSLGMEVDDDKAWGLATSLADRGYLLTQRLGRLVEAYEIVNRLAQEADRRKDEYVLQGSYGNQARILKDWGRLDEAMALLKKKESIAVSLGYQAGSQASYGNQALILQTWGRLDEAMALLKKQESTCASLGDQAGLQGSYGNQALILKLWGRLDEAMDLHHKEESICATLGDPAGLQASYGNQALILQDWGRLEEAMALHQKEESICATLGDQAGLQGSYGNQALILQAWGRLDEAMALLKKQESICASLGDQAGQARSYLNQALVAWHKEDQEVAKEKMERALSLFTKLNMPREIDLAQKNLYIMNGKNAPG